MFLRLLCSLILDQGMATAAISRKISASEVNHAIAIAAMKGQSRLGRGILESIYQAQLQSINARAPVHQAQVLSYLKLSSKSIGLLINFNVVHLKDGIKRFVNGTDWR